MAKAVKAYRKGGKLYGKDKAKRNVLTSKTKRYQQEGLKGDTRSLTKAKVRGGADNNTYKKKTTTYDEGVGTVTKVKRTAGGKRKEKTRNISGKAAHRAIKGGMGRSYKDPNKEMRNGGKVVAQGADRDDVRADRKAARLERRKDRAAARAKRKGDRNFKRDVKSGKLKQVGAGMAAGAKALVNARIAAGAAAGAKAGVKKKKG